ncbi:MAG: epoxyqueuosine reductase [Desulfobacteraceae bacterium]|nr:epoxyqueuosine reductase [Deltaproteobacteria bacterium]MBL6977336.1 epoxyqueuosine reductase [Desulfobacteraceae bacterium]
MPRNRIEDLIRDFIATSPNNNMGNEAKEPAWDGVLVGFASGADPIWQQYKEYVGAFHWTPWEVFNQHHPDKQAGAEELTVISWVLPQREMVRKANRRAKKYPAEEWARIRVYGEEFNVALRRHVVKNLEQTGHAAVAPMLVPNWTIVKSERFSYASSWSERHAAHAAGLGTFGLCDGLITAKGKAMRAGSVVARISIEPTPRPYAHHRAYCLFFSDGSCGKCIDRCPVRAITEDGHDKEKCRKHLVRSREHVKETYKFVGYGCGLCQVGVPCEKGIPVKAAREALERGDVPPPPPPLA